MQSPEKPSSTSTKDSQQKNEGPPKQKQGSRPKFLSGIISAGYIKTEMGQNVSLASGVVLGLVFSCICLLVWTEKADQISPTINLVFIISLIAYNVLSFLKPVNVSIGTVSLRSHITVACCLVNPILIGMVAVFAQNVNVCLALSFNLLNGLKVMPLTGILCRVVITTVVVVLYEKELLMRIAIVCTNTDIVIQFVWVSFLLRRPLKKSPVCKPPTQKLNQKTLKMKILAGARNTRKLEVEDKASIAENLSQSELAEEAPFKIPQSVPKLSLPNLDSSRSDRGPTDRIPIQSAGRQVGQSLEAPRRVSSIQVEMDGPKKDEPSKRDIQYQINIPHQPTDSYRAVPVMQSDPEADTVKGKKSKDYAHGSPRIPKSPTKNQPLTKASSFIVQPEKTPINRVNSFTPANMNPDLLGGQQYMSPSLLSVVPKSSDRKDLSAMMAGLTPSNEISQTSDALKSRVYAEYFEMIDELVLIGDKKLSVIANNFNNNVEARTIKKMSKQFEREILRQKNAPLTLDAYFKSTNPDKGVHMSCSEETLRSLRTIYEAFNYRQTKVSDRDRYEKLKIANILANLEEMTSQLRSQQRAKTGRIREMGGEIVNMTKSTRNIRVGNVTDCRYTIPEVLFLIREYLRLIHGKTLKYHFSNTLIFTFFFQEKTQCKIRLVSVDSTFYLLMLVENISDKVELGELNSKLNYSHMLMKSLSNELKTPVHQVIQVLQELELLLEARATTDPPLLRTIAKFQQIAGGLDITVGNILDYASILNKTIQLKKTKFLLKAFLDELVCCFQEKCKLKKISVQVECDPELIMCTDYNRLRGVLFIFLENSVKFTDLGGINLKAQVVSRNINFKVIDSGSGIKQSDLLVVSDILNNPFSESTTKDAAGLGMGMRVASNILHLLQSNRSDLLNIESKVNQGTTVQFEISQGIGESERSSSSSINSDDEYIASSQSGQEKITTEKAEEKKIEFNNDRANLQSETGFTLYLKKATMSMDSNRGKNQTNAEKVKPIANSNATVKLISAEVKREGFVRGIGNQTLRGVNNFNLGVQKAPPKPKIAAGLTLSVQKQQKVSQKFTGTQSQNNELASQKNRLDSSESEEEMSIEKRSVEGGHEKLRVLIVDDEIINLDFAKLALQTLGCKVYTAKKGEEAILKVEMMLERKITLNLILMDYNMPRLTGAQVTQLLLQEKYKAVVGDALIYGLTAQTDQQTIECCLKAGMHRVFSKPFDFFQNKELILCGRAELPSFGY